MRSVLIVIFLVTLPAFAATKITSQIYEVDVGTKLGDEVLVLLKSGDVARIKRWDLNLIENLQSSTFLDRDLTFTLDKDRFITHVDEPSNANQILSKNEKFNSIDYIPTTVADISTAKKYIAESRRTTKELTQCFNRAMVWSYEWWRKHSLRSNKLFIFWPKGYIRKHTFKWWFHVTPYVHVKDSDGVIKERTLDVKYHNRPYQFQEWADYHSAPDVKCRVIQKYSEYADQPFEDDRCYFIRSDMYTWQPADLEMNEAWGYSKNGFNMDEVRAAYLEAFDIKL